jgi:hypothetical protein
MILAASPAGALPPVQPVTPFDVLGFLQSATLGGTDPFAGGTLTVNNQLITVPRNTIVTMPATFLTWQELFTLAPAPYGPTQTGLAAQDTPAPMTSYEVHVQGNRVGDQWIAGLVNISQHSLTTGQGHINSIDYVLGELRVGGVIGDPTSGQRVRINDPIGRFGRVFSPDVRFTIDEDNPTIRTQTAYPMCLPRFDPAVAPDPDCPQTNRTGDPTTGRFATIFHFPAPGPGVTPDARVQAPFEVGDFVTYSGILVKDGPQPSAGPAPAPGGTYVAAYSMIANLGFFTAPGSDPAYVAVDVTILGVGGAPAPGLPQEATVRTRFEGFTTDPSRVIDLFGIDVDPCSGNTADRPWGAIDVDQGPPIGAVLGRWRFRPPGKVLSMPLSGTFLPATREMRARIRGASVQSVANGVLAGQYHAPIVEFLFPENLGIGNPPVPLNLQDFAFLAQGSGPWSGGGPTPVASGIVSQLTPWPGATAPAAPSCAPKTLLPPSANAGASVAVASGSTVTLDGTGSSDPNGFALSYAWSQTGGTTVALSSPTAARPTFTAPVVPNGQPAVSLLFSLVVTDTGGLASTASTVTITVNPAPPGPLTPSASAGPALTVASGAVVRLDGTASSDPNLPVQRLSFSWSQIAGPGVTLAGATTATPTFTAPMVPPGAPVVMSFWLVVTNTSGLGATAQVDVTVSPVRAPVAVVGPTLAVRGNAAVVLDGTGSFDPNGLPITYQWTQVAGPAVTLTGASTATPSFTTPSLPLGSSQATLGFTLTVTNAFLGSIPVVVAVDVMPAADNIFITLVEYRTTNQRLTVNATSTVADGTAVLTMKFGSSSVTMTSLGGGLYTGIVSGVAMPSSVTVTSNLGGTATSGITRLR